MKYYKLFAVMTLCASLSIFGDSCQTDCGSCGCPNPCGCEQSCDTCCSNPCDCNTSCDPCNTCCCSPCCCEPCDFVPPCPPEECAYNAPVLIDIKCGWDFFVTGSFVYAQASEENLEFMEFQSVTGTSPNFYEERLYSEMCFDYEPAFKVGLGFNFGCDNWHFYAEYFRYHADAGSGSSAKTVADGELFVDTYIFYPETNPILTLQSASGSAKWRLDMDTVDFLLARKYYVGKCLTFEPYAGLRAAWIDQTYKVNYVQEGDGVTLTTHLIEESVNLSSCSWAVGAKTGLQTNWNFCGGFYLFGDSSFDILYTNYEIDSNAEIVTTTTVGTAAPTVENYSINGKKDDCVNYLRPHAQVALGFGWGDYFCCNDWYFDLKIGYEFNVYWNQNVLAVIPDFNQDPSRLYGDLYLHGLVITARLDF